MNEGLNGKTILVMGGAKRVGNIFALACARAGADVVIHHGHSNEEAETTRDDITKVGRRLGDRSRFERPYLGQKFDSIDQ